MAIKFIIDSASDVLPDEAERLGVVHVPMTVRFGDAEYSDAVTLTHREFYERLIETDTLPTTSQIPPAVFSDIFENVTSAGDTAIVITISSELSSVFSSVSSTLVTPIRLSRGSDTTVPIRYSGRVASRPLSPEEYALNADRLIPPIITA